MFAQMILLPVWKHIILRAISNLSFSLHGIMMTMRLGTRPAQSVVEGDRELETKIIIIA